MLFKTADKLLTNFENVLVVTSLSFATLLSFVEVVLRYGFQTSIIWSSELVIVSIIWAVFIGLPVTLRKGGHIKVDVVVNLLSGKKRGFVIFLATMIGVLFSLFLFFFSVKYTAFLKESGEISITTDIPEYIYFMALPVGGFLLSIRYVQELISVLKGKKDNVKDSK